MERIVEEMKTQQTIKKELLDLYIEWSEENWGAIRSCNGKSMHETFDKKIKLVETMCIDKVADIIDDLTFINATNEQIYKVLEVLGYGME